MVACYKSFLVKGKNTDLATLALTMGDTWSHIIEPVLITVRVCMHVYIQK